MENITKFGYEFTPFTEEEHEHVQKFHTGNKKDVNKYVRVGPAGYVLPEHFLTHADGIRDLKIRPDDVFVVSYPRSGTTWTQELVWLINNDLDFEKAKSIPLTKRYPFLEHYMLHPPTTAMYELNEATKRVWEENGIPAAQILNATTSQRFIKTHLPLSLLPKTILDTAKVVYVARDMRDVAVSYYHFFKGFSYVGVQCEFKEHYENMFSKNLLDWSPYFEHIKESWALRDHPNMLFLFYEDLSKDLKNSARRVADFFGKKYTDEQLDLLCNHLAIDNFKKNKAMRLGILDVVNSAVGQEAFIRKGKSGGWRDYFDAEMTQHAARWMEEELRGTGINFVI